MCFFVFVVETVIKRLVDCLRSVCLQYMFCCFLLSDFVQRFCTYDCTMFFFSWESVLISFWIQRFVSANQALLVFACFVIVSFGLIKIGFKCILYTLIMQFSYPFVSISAVNMFDYVLSPNKELELYRFDFSNSIGILIEAHGPSKKKHRPYLWRWVVYFYIPTCVERWSHFSLGEDSTPPPPLDKMTAVQRTWWLLREHQSFFGAHISLMGFVVVIFKCSWLFPAMFLCHKSKRIRCPTHSTSLPFHIPPIHTPPHPSILLMVQKLCTTWNVQNPSK